MLGFIPLHGQLYGRLTSFSRIYSHDHHLDDVARRVAHDHVAAHARVLAIGRQRGQYNRHHGPRPHRRGTGHPHYFGHVASDSFHPGFRRFASRRLPTQPRCAFIYFVEAAEPVTSVL